MGVLEPSSPRALPSAPTPARSRTSAADPGSSRVIAVGDRGYIVLSDDNGRTWRRAKSPAAPLLTAVEFLDANNGWAVGHDSVILATADGGETWVQQFAAPAEQRRNHNRGQGRDR